MATAEDSTNDKADDVAKQLDNATLCEGELAMSSTERVPRVRQTQCSRCKVQFSAEIKPVLECGPHSTFCRACFIPAHQSSCENRRCDRTVFMTRRYCKACNYMLTVKQEPESDSSDDDYDDDDDDDDCEPLSKISPSFNRLHVDM